MKKILMTLTFAFAAIIAIPSVANAQDAKTDLKNECCKEKKECCVENKACCKENQNCTQENKVCCKENQACTQENKARCKENKACPQGNKACCKEGKKAKRAHFGKKMRAEGKRMVGPKDAKMRRGVGENPMFKGITLSEDQQDKIKALREKNLTAEKKSKAEMKAKSKEEMQKLRADFDKDVEKILDKDQLKQYQANKAEMEAKRAEKQSKLPKVEKKTDK